MHKISLFCRNLVLEKSCVLKKEILSSRKMLCRNLNNEMSHSASVRRAMRRHLESHSARDEIPTGILPQKRTQQSAKNTFNNLGTNRSQGGPVPSDNQEAINSRWCRIEGDSTSCRFANQILASAIDSSHCDLWSRS